MRAGMPSIKEIKVKLTNKTLIAAELEYTKRLVEENRETLEETEKRIQELETRIASLRQSALQMYVHLEEAEEHVFILEQQLQEAQGTAMRS